MKRVSIPVIHASAAICHIAEMKFAGINSFFIKVMLDKKLSLPYAVVDTLVEHFVSFRGELRTLPVIWHTAMLTFAQRYKNDIRSVDKKRLLGVIAEHEHYLVSPEIRRELVNSSSRGEIIKSVAGITAQNNNNSNNNIVSWNRSLGQGRVFEEDVRDMPEVLMMEED